MRIGVIGTRGVPAHFGGIEHHVEEIGARLVERGHDVTVFCRRNYVDADVAHHRGMRLRRLPTIGTKYLDALVHSAASTATALGGHFDILHYHAAGPGVFGVVPRYLSSAKVVLTVHSREVLRPKWGRTAKKLLSAADWLSPRAADAVVTVSHALAGEYRARGVEATPIPNGATQVPPRPASEITRRWGLRPASYVLFVGRLDPDKSPDLLIKAFKRLSTDHKLVIAGGSHYADDYVRGLHRLSGDDPRVLFPGYVYGPLLAELYSNAAAFVLPSRNEGLPLVVLEAVSCGTPIVLSDIPAHLELLGGDRPGGRLFRSEDDEDLEAVLRRLLANLDPEREGAASIRERVLREYSWDDAAEATEAVYRQVLGETASAPEGRDPAASR